MNTYARIDNGIVVELFSTDGDITTMFNPGLDWVDVTQLDPHPQAGWCCDGQTFCVAPAPTTDQLATEARDSRDQLLRACDWTALPDVPLADADKTAWSTYRQALRDVPAQTGFPTTITWPTAPGASA